MFTSESFCNFVWKSSYSKVLEKISKEDYKEFHLPKKGGVRSIHYLEKNSSLWKLQHQLLSRFLIHQPLPVCVKGFQKGESYLSYLSEHIGARFFLRVDISSFFPSISGETVKDTFSRLLKCRSDEEKEKLLNLICEITTLNGSLPQGACTSPAVSNLVMAGIDQRITKYCQVFSVRYTRYADDLLFSSDTFDFRERKWFLRKIKYILGSRHLKLNYTKIKSAEERMILNGYIISEEGISLSRTRLADIRHLLSFSRENHDLIRKGEAEKFIQEINKLVLRHRSLKEYPFGTVFQFSQYLCGYRSFLISMLDQNRESVSFQKELRRLIRRIEREISCLNQQVK